MNDPAVLFYTSDFLTGVIDMSMEERGMYITLLCYQHQKGHIEEKTIRFLLGYAKDNLPDVIMKHFKVDNEGKYYNERMDLEKEKRVKFVETRRENGSKGGRPSKKKEKPLGKPSGKPLGKPKNNLMGNDNDNENINNNIYFNNIKLNNIFIDWLEYKKERKETYKETGLKSLITQINNQVEIHGEEEIINLITECMANNYKGIIFDRLKNKKIIAYKNISVEPNWLNKDIDKKEISHQEQEEMKKMLKDFN